MKILAIDPGPVQSGWCVFDGAPVEAGIEANCTLCAKLCGDFGFLDHVVIEQFKCYGMAVGDTTIDAIRWSGRFEERGSRPGRPCVYIPRATIKAHICGSARAKDGNVRRALLDRWPKGNKATPGPTYGYKRDMWAALALAVTWWETKR